MAETEFIIGQRWVSNSEAELGLGIIKERHGRQIEVFFPAVSESRFYAADNAPLSRVVYSLGEQVKTRESVSFTITALQPFNGCFIYQGDSAEGEPVSVHEMDLDSRVIFNQPQDRLFAGQVDKNSQFELRARALAFQHDLYRSPVFGLLGARMQLLPHQLYIAHQVSQRYAPRVLLADEVGLGKTIEAGLVLHQKKLAGDVKRALVIVPDALLHQWLVEMLRRFNLSFTLIDNERHQALTEEGAGNPFDSAQLVLTGLNELLNHPQMQADLLAADWDMLIVDEAHHLYWQEDDVSAEYQLIEKVAGQVPACLLLTATPEQLGVDSHFARLRLLDPDKFHDLAAFREQEASYQPLAALITELDQLQAPLANDAALLTGLRTYLSDHVLTELGDESAFESARDKAIRQLLDYHGTGRLLFRNTREVVSGFPSRILHSYPLETTHADIGLLPELSLGEDWLEEDQRVSWLLDFLQQQRGQKLLLICARAETAIALDKHLSVNHGVRSAAFHEDMTLVNRDRAAAFFADDEGGAQILCCSEIGSEGRNFQFCQHLILFDLPSTPDLLEQRIGRLDRIGQQQDVQIHVPYYQGSSQQVLFDWYQQGMNAFESVFSAGDAVSRETAALLDACLQQPGDSKQLSSLIDTTSTVARQAHEQLASGRNVLLERHSFDEDKAGYLIAELEEVTRGLELADFMDDVFDAFGVEQQPHSSDSVIIKPGQHMSYAQFPGLPEDGLTATYQRHRALGREDMAFLTWEHPMVMGAMDLVIHTDLGNSAFCTLASHQFKAGTLLLEAVFKLQRIAGQSQSAINRFLSEGYLRVVVDESGVQHQSELPDALFNKLAGRIPRATSQELIRHARGQIETLLKQARQAVKLPAENIKAAALVQMKQSMSEEYERLEALAAVNPAIRQAEFDAFSEAKSAFTDTIQTAEFSLDAIRVAIVTEPE